MKKVLLLIVISNLIIGQGVASGNDVEDVIAALRASYSQWQADSKFKGTFRWGRVAFLSREDALKNNWAWTELPSDRPIERSGRANGRIAKMGRDLRIVFEPTTDPIVESMPLPAPQGGASQQAVGGHISFIGYDVITDGRFHLRRHSERTRKYLQDDLAIHPRDIPGEPPVPAYCTFYSLDLMTPLRPLTTLSSDPFDQVGSTPKDKVTVHSEVTNPDRDHYEVTLTAEFKDPEWHSVSKLRFQATPPHRFESFSQESGFADGRKMTSFEVTLSEFVSLPEGDVPRRIRHASFEPEPLGTVAQQEFYSPDLGNEPPTGDDFRYEIPKGILIAGLKNPELIAKKEFVQLSELSDDDFTDVIDRAAAKSTESQSMSKGFWVGLACVAVAMAVGLSQFLLKGR